LFQQVHRLLKLALLDEAGGLTLQLLFALLSRLTPVRFLWHKPVLGWARGLLGKLSRVQL
jgi:hypothetical protein